jgi:deoxyribodipyrimidine photo-lyase
MATQRVLIYLLRRDLRLADNPIFHEIYRSSQQSKCPYTHVLPLYVFSAQQIEVSGFLSSSESSRSPYPEARSQHGGFWRCGTRRATFLAESVWDLKTALESAGSGLTVRVGMVADVIRDLLDAFKSSDSAEVFGLWMTSEEGIEEKREERQVRRILEAAGKEFRLWTDEKYYIDEYVLYFPHATDMITLLHEQCRASLDRLLKLCFINS